MSEAKPSIKIEINNEKSTINITIVDSGTVSLDAKSVSELIKLLAQVRDGMVPIDKQEIPEPGLKLLTSTSARWYIEAVKDSPGSIAIAVFHPGPGWTGMILDQGKAAHLRDIIEYSAKLTSTH